MKWTNVLRLTSFHIQRRLGHEVLGEWHACKTGDYILDAGELVLRNSGSEYALQPDTPFEQPDPPHSVCLACRQSRHGIDG